MPKKRYINQTLFTLFLFGIAVVMPTTRIYAYEYGCGQQYEDKEGNTCNCQDSEGREIKPTDACGPDLGLEPGCGELCCGFWDEDDHECNPSDKEEIPTPTSAKTKQKESTEETSGGGFGGREGLVPGADDLEVDAITLLKINPFHQFSNKKEELYKDDAYELSVAKFINRALEFIFPLAGLILFVMIVWGGFEMLTSAASKKGMDAGKQRVTAALIGFLVLFASYWIIQIVQEITGVVILG